MSTQAQHDAWHPGKVCNKCPRTLAHQAQLEALVERIRLPWWRRWFR